MPHSTLGTVDCSAGGTDLHIGAEFWPFVVWILWSGCFGIFGPEAELLCKDNDTGSLAGELNLRYVSVGGGVRKSELKHVLE